MDDSLDMLRDALGKMFADVVEPRRTVEAEHRGNDERAWQQLMLMGVAGREAMAMTIEQHAVALQAIGYAGALVPYAESEVLGRWLAQGAGIDVSDTDVLTVLAVDRPSVKMSERGASIPVKEERIPWGRAAGSVLVSFSAEGRDYVAVKPMSSFDIRPASNMAGEPSDIVLSEEIRIDAQDFREVGHEYGPDALRTRGALCRAVTMLGALTRATELTLQYACDRKQFNRPISQFQIIQSHLAAMAGELGAASAIVSTAITAAAGGNGLEEIAAAKVRVGQAVRTIASLSHQIHGAIGFTLEYPLNLWTRRLWAWREEYGNEADWARRLGALLVARGADEFWPRLTAQPGARGG